MKNTCKGNHWAERDAKIIHLRDVERMTWEAIGRRFYMTDAGALKAYQREMKRRELEPA